MSKPRSNLIDYNKVTYRTVRGFTTEMHLAEQGKHLPGQRNYDPSKSTVTLSITETQKLIEKYAGTGHREGQNKEAVQVNRSIGIHKD